MISQKYSSFGKYLFIFSMLFLLSGCDIIDSALGGGPTPPDDTKAIDRIEIEYLIDNAKCHLHYHNPSQDSLAVTDFTGLNFGTGISSITGQSKYEGNRFLTSFNNPEVLGQTIRGHMNVYFFEDPRKVNIDILQMRSHNSLVFGSVTLTSAIVYNGIPYSQSYIDSFTDLEVDEYYISSPSVSSNTTYFAEQNDIYDDLTEPTVCGNKAFIKVKVHYK